MPAVNYQEFLRSRRSVRRFLAGVIAREIVERILTTSTFASSAHNRQPWRFAVVTSAGARSRLAMSMAEAYRRDLSTDQVSQKEIDQIVQRSTQRIKAAPVLVVLCMDSTEMDSYSDPRRAEAERVMAVQSTANAGMLMLLAAHAEGLGAVWNCAPLFAPQEVGGALGLPAAWEPQAMLMMGAPAEAPEARPRKPLSSILRHL
jgi:coenzyme F420-0:L-glutamate ligase/coenzyme F420-1:gamma-L-glutamate ligase